MHYTAGGWNAPSVLLARWLQPKVQGTWRTKALRTSWHVSADVSSLSAAFACRWCLWVC